MKVAIIGSGPLAIELGLKLSQEEASVTIFTKSELGGSLKKLQPIFGESLLGKDFSSISTLEGRKILSKDLINLSPTLNNYWNEYFQPICESEKIKGLCKVGEVIRIKKCFFSPNEEKRLRDLFRVYYSIDPKDSILKSVKENPGVFENLGKEVLNSLNETMEFFEDFDLVVDARGVLFNPLPMGSSQGEALNEAVISKSTPVYYGLQGFFNLEKIKSESKSILIVGSGKTAGAYLELLKDWIFLNSESKILLITKEDKPFSNLQNTKLDILFKEINEEFEKRANTFQDEINKWKDLDDFVKVKIPKPLEPYHKLEMIKRSTVSSLDKLLDRSGLFVTIESLEGVRTLAVDSILVATGYKINTTLFKGLQMDFNYGEKTAKAITHTEPGIYTLGPVVKDDRYDLKAGIEQIPLICENMFTFFSKIQ